MTRTSIRNLALLAVALLAFEVKPGAQVNPEVALRAAMDTETVKGDLKGAIAQYEKIAQGSNRTLAAKALVRMAECYQKLGDAEAQRIYERIVREFADQTEAVSVARAHLGRTDAAATASGMTTRRLLTWTPNKDFFWGTISPNGFLVSYTDWETGNLGLYEVATGRDRHITNSGTWEEPVTYAEASAISRDGKQVAYSWFSPQRRYELRLASLEGAAMPESRLLFNNEDVAWVLPNDWSPDGNSIAVQLVRKDNTEQMGLVSVRDGSLRVLKSSGWQGAQELFFSPDGKYLGFDAPVGETANDQRDVFILAVDGSRETPAVVGSSNDTMMGWSPDGKYLLFASDRGATVGLWGVPIADGKPLGPPELMRSEISRISLGVTARGSLYTEAQLGGRDIQVATVEFETGKLLSRPFNPAKSFMGFNQNPEWSPDGKYLSYASNRNRAGNNRVIAIWSAETGQTRDLVPRMNYWGGPRWAPDGRSLLVSGRDLKNRAGLYEIDAQSGEATLMVLREQLDRSLDQPQLSRDGKSLYYRKNLATDGSSFVERDIASGKEREIIRRKMPGNGFALSLSPDESSIATTYNDRSTKSSVALLIPVAGGEARELFRVSQPQELMQTASWTPDGRAIIVDKVLKAGATEREFWLIPTAGGQPRKIDVGTTAGLGPAFRVHPDGRQIAYVVGDGAKQELWVLENFLPALDAKK